MDKIVPIDYITDNDPVPITVRNASEWYTTIYIQVDTESTSDDQLVWLMAQGWTVYKIIVHNISISTAERYYTWYLSRRSISGEKVLKAMVEDYSAAYNEGRELNDTRYDDIVSIYSVVAEKTQDDLQDLVTDNTAYDALVEAWITAVTADWTSHDTELDGDLDTYGTSQVTRINNQFNSELAKARATMVNQGIYNTTTWASASAGIETKRAEALNDHYDRVMLLQTGLTERLYATKTQMRDRVLAARDRLFRGNHSDAMSREAMRAQVMAALSAFMERRTDSYPDLTAIGQAAAELGSGSPISGTQP